jgi:hypothetical protein
VSAKGGFMDDGELMLQKSYGKLETSVTGYLTKDVDPRLQEVLRMVETSATGDLMKDEDLKLQEILCKTGDFCYRRYHKRWGSYATGYLTEIGSLYFRKPDGTLGACVAGGLIEDWRLLLQGVLTIPRKLLQLEPRRRIL